jgi:tripartite-type tricarboxylate transporter receptor subunit TctC
MLLAALVLAGVSGHAVGQINDFYRGKVLTIIMPNSPSASMMRYARMIAPYIAKYSGVREVRINNIRGAGGLIGTNTLWHAKPDGFTIAFTSVPALLLAQLSGSEGVQFDATKFVYLGRVSHEPRVFAVGGNSDIKTIQDLHKRNRPFIFPTQGTDEDFYTMAVLADALGFELKAVTGYEGNADTALAVIKGDGNGHITAWSASLPAIKAGDKRPILTIGSVRFPEYPDVPTVLEVVPSEKQAAVRAIVNMLEMHRGFFGPPKMDPQAVIALRAAIKSALNDPELQAEAKKNNLPLDPADGAAEQAQLEQIARASANIVPILKAALKSIR